MEGGGGKTTGCDKIYLLMNIRSSGHVGRLYVCLVLPYKNHLPEYFCFFTYSIVKRFGKRGELEVLEFKVNTNE